MKEQKKKQIIAILLLISCFISGFMLFATSEGDKKRFQNISQADSLIQQTFHDFNIGEEQVRILTTPVDSNFIRKTYRVGLAYGFSKTQFHSELNRTFHDFGIRTPAKVSFPEQNVDIHLLYQGNVIRTISLQTDPDLTVNRNYVSLLVAFEQLPDEELISQLQRLGEPIPMVFKIENPMQANDILEQLDGQYNHIFFWLKNRNGNDLLASGSRSAVNEVKKMESILPGANIFQMQTDELTRNKLVAETDMTIVSAANALILDGEAGETVFFEKFYKLQTNPAYSMAVISGNNTTLEWLQTKLPELKKAGIRLVLPSQLNF